mgnify:CR=1 FL=1
MEAKVVIEGWRVHYNEVRPHSSLKQANTNEFKSTLENCLTTRLISLVIFGSENKKRKLERILVSFFKQKDQTIAQITKKPSSIKPKASLYHGTIFNRILFWVTNQFLLTPMFYSLIQTEW